MHFQPQSPDTSNPSRDPSDAPPAPHARPAPPLVLSSGSAGGTRVAVVRYDDGTLAVAFPREPDRGELRWPAEGMDECMAVYLALLRRHPLPA